MSSKFEITCIVSLWNSSDTILDTLVSIQKQTFKNFECIVVDDCSSDLSAQKVDNFISEDPRFILVRNSVNRGKSYGCNTAIEKCKSEYIVFVDSDDYFDPKAFERRLFFFNKPENRDQDVLFFPNLIKFQSQAGEFLTVEQVVYSSPIQRAKILSDFLRHNLPLRWQHSVAIWKKSSLLSIGLFNNRLFRLIDADLFTRALLHDLKFKEIFATPDFYYRMTIDDSITDAKRLKFIDGSLIYMDNILFLVKERFPQKEDLVRANFKKFVIHLYFVTLLSSQFTAIKVTHILDFGLEQGLLSNFLYSALKQFVRMNFLSIIRLKGIRGTIWYLSNCLYYNL